MSNQQSEEQGRPSDSDDWRAPPPHLTPSTGTDGFVSASSHVSPPPPGQRQRAESETSGERTSSPGALSGLTATVHTDSRGRRYFQETSTNLRIDIFDYDGQPIPASPTAAPTQLQNDNDGPQPSSTLSDESDLTPETRSDAPATDNPESLLKALLDEIEPSELSPKHIGTLQAVYGALVTSRTRLLNTTAVVVDQRKSSLETRESLQQFRDETAERFTAFDEALTTDRTSLERCIQDNLKLLAELGQSEETMAHILQQVRSPGFGHGRPLPVLPQLSTQGHQEINEPMVNELNSALPPRQPHETMDEFRRRAALSAASKRRAADAFPLPAFKSDSARPSAPAHVKYTRFEDPGSISSAPRYRQRDPEAVSTGFGPSVSAIDRASGIGKPTFDAMEEFNAEAEALIRSIIYRQVGTELANVPSRVRAPKLDNPSKFSGANNHQGFITFVEELTTWMRASFMGGPGTDTYRITVLKTFLAGNALQWFLDYVETKTGNSLIPYEFDSIICAMHQRFVTAATAQQASREFEAVKYKAENGPLKLMDELLDASNRMREPMPDFIIRQRFMRLLPDYIGGLMNLHRNLSAEYSDIATLRYHANQIWDVYNINNKLTRNTAGINTSTPAAASSTAPRPPAAARRESPRPTSSQPHPPERRAPYGNATAAATQGTQTVIGPNAHKKCYKCGYMGHIGTDKICPKYTDPPRVAAQRVEDGYVEEDHAEVDYSDHHHAHELVDDHWGGSQYDPDAAPDDHPSPEDLGELVNLDNEPTPRIGAMHFQGYAMRVEPDLLDLMDTDISPSPLVIGTTLTRTQSLLLEARLQGSAPSPTLAVAELYEETAVHDIIVLREYRRGNLMDPFSDAELDELRRELVLEHEYPVSRYTNYDDVMHHFRLHEGPATSESMDEWAAITTLGAAEHCEIEAAVVRSMRLGHHMNLSTGVLAMGIDRLTSDAAEYVPHLQALREAQSEAAAVRDTAQLALDEADARTNPHSTGRAQGIRRRTLEVYEEVLADVTALHAGHSQSIRHLEALQSVIVEELRIRLAEQQGEADSDGPRESSTPGSSDEEGEVEREVDPSLDDSDGDSESPPPSYRSDSTHNPNASPPVSESGDLPAGSSLTHLDWHDIMAAAATATNFAVNRDTGVAPVDAVFGPPEYSAAANEATIDSSSASPLTDQGESSSTGLADVPQLEVEPSSSTSASEAPTLSLMSRRLVGEYYPHLRDDSEHGAGGSHAYFGSEFEDRSAGELQFIFGEGQDGLDRNWPTLPEIDTGVSLQDHIAQREMERNNTATLDGSPSAPDPVDDASTPDLIDFSSEVEEYTLVDLGRSTPEPRASDELVVQAVLPILGQPTAERCSIYVDCNGTLYTRISQLPDDHYLSPAMHAEHIIATNEAVSARASELNCSPNVVRSMIETGTTVQGMRERVGFRDEPPQLLPGGAFYERLASSDPEHDDSRALPGFRVQTLAQRIEHIANVNRADSIPRVGIASQPIRDIQKIACLTAELEIGGSKAYILFDSGSNTDSLTPEYARSANCNVFRLEEPVTLQLGCVGSRSHINFGARPSINFGGIKGHAYFDVANLDRYDGIIGTPFMIKHGLVLDFLNRQIIFPKGRVIQGLTVMADLSLVKSRQEAAAARPVHSRA
ncbi:hypothetical protein DFH06DRAFT_1329202 [Mycena polygramma]|nr:hypothetical protein DFH06DRAFT_1351316 [Mycena polygramma]KAJ7655768.1 hypothetical protein DFH06DRAFT_1329202 [Mycena polygramma]